MLTTKIDCSPSLRLCLSDGVTYSVPTNVSVTADNQVTRGEYITFPDGRTAAGAFSADASYPLRYFAVSGTSSGAYAARKSFLEHHQFAFFSYAQGSYTARLRDFAESLVEAPLITGLQGIPTPFNPSNEATVRRYRDFFRSYGSHIIVNVNYGARYPLVRLICILNYFSNVVLAESLGFD